MERMTSPRGPTPACDPPMIAREGRVVEIHQDPPMARAVVRFERASACTACRAARLCAGNSTTRDLALALPAGYRLSVGDRVRVGVPEASALRATLIAYITPLAGLLAGLALGSAAGFGDAGAAVLGFSGLGGGLWAMRHLAERPANRLEPVLLDPTSTEPTEENHS